MELRVVAKQFPVHRPGQVGPSDPGASGPFAAGSKAIAGEGEEVHDVCGVLGWSSPRVDGSSQRFAAGRLGFHAGDPGRHPSLGIYTREAEKWRSKAAESIQRTGDWRGCGERCFISEQCVSVLCRSREHEVKQGLMAREFTAFLVHQMTGTLGVIMVSAMSWYTFLELLRLGRITLVGETAAFPLLGIPGFPLQATSGFVLGLTLARRLPARAVVFAWILPFLWFWFGAFVVAPTSKLAYLVGGSCSASRGCFYQLSFTLPLIASIAYVAGAVVSRWLQRRSKSSTGRIRV